MFLITIVAVSQRKHAVCWLLNSYNAVLYHSDFGKRMREAGITMRHGDEERWKEAGWECKQYREGVDGERGREGESGRKGV